jgi:hypothetical protein
MSTAISLRCSRVSNAQTTLRRRTGVAEGVRLIKMSLQRSIEDRRISFTSKSAQKFAADQGIPGIDAAAPLHIS